MLNFDAIAMVVLQINLDISEKIHTFAHRLKWTPYI